MPKETITTKFTPSLDEVIAWEIKNLCELQAIKDSPLACGEGSGWQEKIDFTNAVIYFLEKHHAG